MLRAAAHRLHRRDHVACRAAAGPSAPAASSRLRSCRRRRRAARVPASTSPITVGHTRSPSPLTTGVRAAVLERLVGEQRRVNAAVDDVARRARCAARPDFVAAQRIQRVDADADHVAGRPMVSRSSCSSVSSTMCGSPYSCGRRRRQHVEPAGRNHRNAKRHIAWIDQMDAHQGRGLASQGSPSRAASVGRS